MNGVEVLQRLNQHRAWVNGNLLTAAAALSDEQLRQTFPIGQGSVWKSLLHMYAAERVWLETMLGNEAFVTPGDVPGKLPGNQEGPGGIADLDDLRRNWEAVEQRWAGYFQGLTPEVLNGVVYRRSAALGIRLEIRRGDALIHVCTHAAHTAAQVVNMFRQLGVGKLPETMVISLAMHEMKGATPRPAH